MPTKECPNCKTIIPNETITCPQCKYSFSEGSKDGKGWGCLIVILFYVVGMSIYEGDSWQHILLNVVFIGFCLGIGGGCLLLLFSWPDLWEKVGDINKPVPLRMVYLILTILGFILFIYFILSPPGIIGDWNYKGELQHLKMKRTLILPLCILMCSPSLRAIDVPLNTTAKVYFSPAGGCTDAIIKEIGISKSEILIQAYSF